MRVRRRDLVGKFYADRGPHLAALIDAGGHPGVGGSQHEASGLLRAHLRHLQVLLGRRGLAPPGVIGEIGQARSGGQLADAISVRAAMHYLLFYDYVPDYL